MALPATYVKFTQVLAAPQKPQFFNVFYYKPVAAPTFTSNLMTDSYDLGVAISAIVISGLPNVLTMQSEVLGWNCDLITGGQSYTTAGLNDTLGMIDSDEEPDFTAVVIQKRTATAGKSGRGRWYLGPVPESLTDENYVITADLISYGTVASAWMTTINALAVDWKPQLYSKKNASLMEIVSTFVDPKLGRISGRKSHSIL